MFCWLIVFYDKSKGEQVAMQHGGKRKDAGRPPRPDDQKAVYKTLGVRLTPEFFEKIEHVAHLNGVSKSDIVRKAIEIYIEK